jgi:nucleoside-diphosphate-sugar epimerase
LREGGKASLAAEQELATHRLATRSVALRLAGLYGPGRIPHLDKLRAGEPIAAPSLGWLNLIHLDDAATVVLAAEAWLGHSPGDGPHLFCVTGSEPVLRANYYREVARRIGAEPPQFVSPDPNSPAAERARANRRVSGEKMLEQLGVQLAYPTHREGLAAILPQ